MSDLICIGGPLNKQVRPSSSMETKLFRVPGTLMFERYWQLLMEHPVHGAMEAWVHDSMVPSKVEA